MTRTKHTKHKYPRYFVPNSKYYSFHYIRFVANRHGLLFYDRESLLYDPAGYNTGYSCS